LTIEKLANDIVSRRPFSREPDRRYLPAKSGARSGPRHDEGEDRRPWMLTLSARKS
jgi:hypothetical protein